MVWPSDQLLLLLFCLCSFLSFNLNERFLLKEPSSVVLASTASLMETTNGSSFAVYMLVTDDDDDNMLTNNSIDSLSITHNAISFNLCKSSYLLVVEESCQRKNRPVQSCQLGGYSPQRCEQTHTAPHVIPS